VSIQLETGGGIWAPMKSRNFSALWLGQSLSSLGDALFSVMLPIEVYSLTDSTLVMGILMMLLMLPMVLLLPFTGLLVDYVSRVRLMMVADSVRLILLTVLAYLAATHDLRINVLYFLAILFGTMEALFQPAYSAVRSQVFTEDIRNAANALTQISMQSARLIGPAAGGILIGVLSPALGFSFDALTFAVSIVSLLFLKLSFARQKPPTRWGTGVFFRELMGGYVELKKQPWLWITILVFSLVNIAASGVTAVVLPWLIKVHLALPDSAFGLIMSGQGAGAILMAYLFGRRSLWRHRGVIAYVGVAVAGIGILGAAFIPSVAGLMIILALSGGGFMVFGLIWEGSLQELVPNEAYGRVSSLDMLGSFALMPLGYLLAGWLAQQFSGVLVIAGGGLMVLLLAAGTLLVPSIRRFQ
jgi:MFS family permease